MRIKDFTSRLGSIFYNIPNSIVFSTLIIMLLYFMRRIDFNLFHISVEFFSIIVSTATFIIIWNLTERNRKASYLLLIGVAFLFVGLLDFFHAISYKGLQIFMDNDANLPTQLWIAARYLQSISIFVAILLSKRGFNRGSTFIFFSILTIVLIYFIFSGRFPDCYIDGTGLTSFKIFSEYIIIAILILTLYLIGKRKDIIRGRVKRYIMISVFLTIISEFLFTKYFSVFGEANMYGHFFKLFSFIFIYKAFIESTIKMPAQILYSNLEDSQKRLGMVKKKIVDEKDMTKSNEINDHSIIGMAAHDLRNPLFLIDNYLELLKDEMNEGNINSSKEVFDIIEKQITYSNRLINNMLDLGKIESDDYSVQKELFNINELLSEVVNLWNIRAKQNKVRLFLNIEDKDINIHVSSDSFIQIMGNLISNSIKYSKEGSEIALIARKDYGDCIIEIKDEGMGIRKEDISKLFIPFQRFSNKPINNERSTGLGLCIVKRLIELNDGRIEIDSTYGVGTNVRVIFKCMTNQYEK